MRLELKHCDLEGTLQNQQRHEQVHIFVVPEQNLIRKRPSADLDSLLEGQILHETGRHHVPGKTLCLRLEADTGNHLLLAKLILETLNLLDNRQFGRRTTVPAELIG